MPECKGVRLSALIRPIAQLWEQLLLHRWLHTLGVPWRGQCECQHEQAASQPVSHPVMICLLGCMIV